MVAEDSLELGENCGSVEKTAPPDGHAPPEQGSRNICERGWSERKGAGTPGSEGEHHSYWWALSICVYFCIYKTHVFIFWTYPSKCFYYHMWNRLPAQARCVRQDAQGSCTGMTLRDGMGREVEGGFRMGNTCTPEADSCQCMAKTTAI